MINNFIRYSFLLRLEYDEFINELNSINKDIRVFDYKVLNEMELRFK